MSGIQGSGATATSFTDCARFDTDTPGRIAALIDRIFGGPGESRRYPYSGKAPDPYVPPVKPVAVAKKPAVKRQVRRPQTTNLRRPAAVVGVPLGATNWTPEAAERVRNRLAAQVKRERRKVRNALKARDLTVLQSHI